jgi:hypothetical protein
MAYFATFFSTDTTEKTVKLLNGHNGSQQPKKEVTKNEENTRTCSGCFSVVHDANGTLSAICSDRFNSMDTRGWVRRLLDI